MNNESRKARSLLTELLALACQDHIPSTVAQAASSPHVQLWRRQNLNTVREAGEAEHYPGSSVFISSSV